MYHTCSTANSRLDHFLIGILLSLDAHLGIERSSTQPEVGIVASIRGLFMDMHTLHVLQQFLIQSLHMLMVSTLLMR